MRYSVTGAQMKAIDRDTIDRIGIPSMVLMERAALEVAEAAHQLAGSKNAQILVACGTGNNGADGIAVGRILFLKGYGVTVLLSGNLEHSTSEHRLQRKIGEQMGLPMVEYKKHLPGSYHVIVDAVFGVGLTRDLAGDYADLITMLADQEQAKVVAVDMPSGIHPNNGAVMGTALKAQVTVTFGFEKTGLLRFPGKEYAGVVKVADIGFSDASLRSCGWDTALIERVDLTCIPKREVNCHKGDFGKVLVIAGSKGMSGAAYLSGLAASRMGAGLVKILTVEENRVILQSQLPEAMVAGYEADEILQNEVEFSDWLDEQCQWATAVVMGPGLGQEPYVEKLVELVLTHVYVSLVLDADALNTIAANPYLTGYYTENILITPHMREMSRLTGKTIEELKLDGILAAREYSRHHGITCVLKDAVSVIAGKDEETFLNTSGSSALAKGGSGDVLSGMIGGLLAMGMEPVEAAAFGVYLHGLAGQCAARDHGLHGVLAHELTNYLGKLTEETGVNNNHETL